MHSVGKSFIRKDSLSKVKGTAAFANDLFFDGLLYAYTFRSPYPHIRIKNLDVREARAYPGVKDIITHREIPGEKFVPLVFKDYPLLVEDEGKFFGQAIAIIVADSIEAGKEAAQLIKLDYEKLPVIFNPLEALEKEAIKIYGEDNIFKSFRITKGNAEAAFKKCDLVLEKEYTANYQVHTYMEPPGMVAVPASDGLEVFGSMQCPFYILEALSAILKIDRSKIRVVQIPTGGGFGGKEDVPSIVASQAALACLRTRRPVKLVYEREEDFHSMSKRHPGYAKVKYGVDKKTKKILACQVKYVLDGGAYSTLSPIVLWRGTVHSPGPYNIPNIKVETYAVATNKVPCGAYRGFGQPQIAFAQESLIDEIANELKISPILFRKINGLKRGDKTPTGYIIKEETGIGEVMEAVLKKYKSVSNKSRRKSDSPKKYGVGIAATFYGVGLGKFGAHLSRAGAFVQVEQDGSIRLAFGNTEMGQGAKTVLAQICAETLNAPYEKVFVMDPDTSRVPDSGPTVASRTTVMSGNAIINAGSPIFLRMKKIAAGLLGVKINKVVAGDCYFTARIKKKKVSYFQVVEECYKKREKMSEEGYFVAPPTTYAPETGIGTAYYTYTFSANLAEVEVDIELGTVKVLRVIAAHDIGKAINPAEAKAQIQGGALQGVGYALYENLVLKDGIIQNPNFTGYIIPTTLDLPEIIPLIIENPYKEGPYGARGLGEPPLIGVAPAIANAIFNATGKRVRSLPIIPEKIMGTEIINSKYKKSNVSSPLVGEVR